MTAALGGPLDSKLSLHHVRDVAPKKHMLCLTFRVPAQLALQRQRSLDASPAADEVPQQSDTCKRQRT